MRIASMFAPMLGLMLLTACSHESGRPAEPEAQLPATSTTPASATPTTTTTTTAVVPSTAPAAGAAMPEVIRWVEAGTAADAAEFHSATRDGETTSLGTDISFVAPSGTRCATDKNLGGQLSCLVTAAGLPQQPADVEGEWVPGWVDLVGTTLDIGSLHGDPGQFTYGNGAQLPAGQSLAFGDYHCRGDDTTLVCVDYAHQSGVRIDASGVTPLGCLKPAPPPVGVGRQFTCNPL